jgi:nitrogen regulatory protein PII
MTIKKLFLVVIIAEPILKDKLITIVKNSGAREHTFSSVNGEGTTEIHGTEWEGEFVKIESIVSESVADEIFKLIKERYLKNHALIIYKHPVEVIRSEKF